MISGARQAQPSWFRRLVSGAISRELTVFVVPGPEVARARGLDLEAADLRVAYTPRHANVLVVVGELPEGLKRAAAVVYAQTPRPRAVLAVGAEDLSPLPGPEVSTTLGQRDLEEGVARLRRLFAEGAFQQDAPEFDVPAIRSRTEYVCPMHPEVVQDEPGTCPKCGMDLVSREAAGETGHGDEHHGHTEGEEHAAHDDGSEDRGSPGGGGSEYTCPMHPEVVQDEPGSCPICGMDLVPREEAPAEEDGEGEGEHGHDEAPSGGHDHAEHGAHDGMDHGEMGFMSMIEMTKDLPRSSDGLQMEWIEVPFGPLFPGLSGGLTLAFTLDGDTVAEAEAGSLVGARTDDLAGPVGTFADRVAGIDRLSPVCYRLLALRAVDSAVGAGVEEATTLARAGALERERAAAHLNWLANFAHLIGYSRLARQAGELQLALARVDADGVEDVRAGAERLARRIERTPLLRYKLAGIGALPDPFGATGPVARAAGVVTDARAGEAAYRSLGFEPVVGEGNDALTRLRVRLAETRQSLDLVLEAGFAPPNGAGGEPVEDISGSGTATVETPRGTAALTVALEDGEVSSAELETPSGRHLGLVGAVTEQRELADALVAVASLDISPWEVLR